MADYPSTAAITNLLGPLLRVPCEFVTAVRTRIVWPTTNGPSALPLAFTAMVVQSASMPSRVYCSSRVSPGSMVLETPLYSPGPPAAHRGEGCRGYPMFTRLLGSRLCRAIRRSLR
jgi:hypothetical protein